jgi:hypothetical protein
VTIEAEPGNGAAPDRGGHVPASDLPAGPPPAAVEVVDQYGRHWLHDVANDRWTLVSVPILPPLPKPPPRWWLRGLIAAWVVILVGLIIWQVERNPGTIREQTDVESAQPVIDGAIGRVLAIVGPQPVVSISGFRSIGGCEVTAVRAGQIYARTLHVYTPAGTEGEVMDRIAAGLPPSYRAKVTRTAGVPRLAADAGSFVRLRASSTGTGDVEVTADTGCRPVARPDGRPQATPAVDPAASAADQATATHILGSLGVAAAGGSVHQLGCVRTVETISQTGAAPGALGVALGPKLGLDKDSAGVLLADDRVAYRSGGADIAVRASGDTVTVTRTTRC